MGGGKSSENKGETPLSEQIATASAEVDTEPTEAQKEAGNYKKGHVQVGTFDITIEQPQGSVRKGTDADGKKWESKMHNTYGYFRGTEGVDGDHIDVFLSNDIDGWNGRKVYVVDQYNPDGTFDEHKVMLGFNDMDEAKGDYLANYEKGWEDGRRIVVSATNLEDFEKWIDSSHRKTKPFAEYAEVKKETVANAPAKEETTEHEGIFKMAERIAKEGKAERGKKNKASADVKTNSTEARQKAKDGKPRLQKMDDSSVMDAEYFAAVERGDMEEAHRIVDEAAERAGYSVGSDYQGTSAFNGAAPYGNGYFLTKEERKEAWDNGDFEGESTLGDYIDNGVDGGNLEELTNNSSYRHADDMRKEAIENVRDAIENGRNTITMYRSVPSSVQEGKFRNGDWITPSRKYAEDNAEIHGWGKDYRIIEQKVSVDDVWFDGNDIAEWGYGREKDYVNDTDFAYKNTENNRKLLDVITRDDDGNIIPPSERFNRRKADERYQKGGTASRPTQAETALRDAVIDHLRENGMDVIDNDTEGQRVLDMVNGRGKLQMGDAPETFAERQKKAVENHGVVMPGLNETDVEVVKDIPRHRYTGGIAEATKQAVEKAKEKYAPGGKAKVLHYDNNGAEFDYVISGNAIEICLSPKHQAKSGNKGVHLALAEHLDEVINKSIEVEEHPDYIKDKDGKRGDEINPDGLMHRFYGVAIIDGVPCRVMTLMREDGRTEMDNGIHSYEVQKIEVLDKELPSTSNGVGKPINEISAYPLAKLLKGVEKAHDKGKNLLEESKKRLDNLREHRVYHGSGADFDHFDHSHMGEGEGAQAYGCGTYVTEVEGIGRTYAEQGRKDVPEFVYDGKEMDFSRLAAELSDMAGENNYGILTHFLWEWNRNGGHRAKEYLAYEIREAKYRRNHSSNPTAYDEEIAGLEALLKVKGIRKNTKTNKTNLYTIEIPEDNGENYLDWDKPLPDGFDKEAVKERVMDDKRTEDELENGMMERDLSDDMDYAATGKDLYKAISLYMGDKAASEMLHDIGYVGIKYPADNMRGGRSDGAKNYVIFNEKDLKITDHVRFFRTADGEAYGFTVGGRIYIDPRIATSETPIHEYAHLWATALRNGNPKEWRNVVGLMKGTPVWDEVKKRYPELETDDEIADEVIAAYSGRRGAERLREEAKETADGDGGVFEKAKAVGALQRVRAALGKFWRAVADFLHIHYTSAEEVADRVMKDLLDGIDPRSMMDGGKSLRPDTEINVVEGAEEHGFKNYAEAKEWAKDHIVRTYNSEETSGKGDIRIGRTAVDKYLSQSAVDKSESKDVHLSVLKVLPDVIRESVDAEQHADYKMGEDGVRSEENGINPNVTIHRLYGAVSMDGRLYRVKVTLKEDTKSERSAKKAYSYEATKIELLAGTLGKPEGDAPNTNNSITAANLLKGVEKSYGGGRFFEDEDKVRLEEAISNRTLAGVHNISEDKLRKALKLGGLANPSVAVIDTDKQGHTGYGEISLVLPSSMVAKRTGRNAGTFFGDAWTPTYPQVERIFGKGGSERAVKDIESVPDVMERMTRNAVDSWLDGRNADDLAYLYLQEHGKQPHIVVSERQYPETLHNDVKEVLGGYKSLYDVPEERRRQLLDIYVREKFGGNMDEYAKDLQNKIQKMETAMSKHPKSSLTKDRQMRVDDMKRRGYDYDALSRFVDDLIRDEKNAGKPLDYATMQKARDYIKENHLQKGFEEWKENLAERYKTKEVIFNGFTPSGKRRYVDNTLENVSKLMKQKGRNGAEGWGTSFNNFAANIMQSSGTLKGIKAHKEKLTDKHEDIDAFTEKWGEVYNHLADVLNPNADISTMDVGYYRLQETAVQKEPKEFAKKEYGVELSDNDVQQLDEMVKAIREERPAMYFETKFERPVMLDEFAAAVVPQDLGADVRKGLEYAGLQLFDYDSKKEGDRKRAFDEAVRSDEKIRFQFVGERGAAAADHAEEVTTRLDNLSVAREMEVAKKDAKAIKMATGWERGADGKWRYEIPDCKVSSTMDIGGKVVKRNEEDMLWTSGKLGDVVDAPELLAAYPELEQVRLETDEIMDDMPSNGEYNPRTNTITIHADELKYLNSILNHEIQHAIQHLEGFARGGNPADIDRGKANIREVFDKISNGLDDAAKLRGIPTENEWLQSLDGDAVKVMEKQLKAYQGKNFALTRVYVDNVGFDNHDKELLHAKLDQANDIIEKQRKELGGTEYIGNSFEAYRRLGGEVESRNVEKRMGMAAEERRASLAAETEDVSREDQIFLMDEGEGDSYSLREADGEEDAEVKYRTSGELDEEKRFGENEPKTLKGEKALTALDNIFNEQTNEILPRSIPTLEKFKEVLKQPIRTFLGELVKVKGEVFNKIIREKRLNISGAVLSTIENADFAIHDTDGSTLYVKRFKSDSSDNTYNIVVVNKHGEVEDYVSSVHIKRNGNLRNKIKNGAELLLPQERNTDGTLFRNNSTPIAKVEKKHETAKLFHEISKGSFTVGDTREAMAARAVELAGRLNTAVRIVRTDEEVAALPSARQRRMKGSFNPMTGEVTVVVPNNANMADVENTFLHEVVGHDGLHVLFPEEEKLNNALDELYRVSNQGIQQTIDRMAQKMYDAEVDRLRGKKRKAHEANGDAAASGHYYADMAEAHAEAGRKRGQFRREATEEYGAELAGRIGESGFEKMSADELTFWGKLKAMLQKALQKLLDGLKIPGKKKWGDKEWAFVLHEAYKRKKNGGRPTVFDAADTEVMRRKTGFGDTKFSDGKNTPNEPKPIGHSTFGSVYNQFKGKVLQAVKFLVNHESGDLLGVFHRNDIGDIDMVWGDEGGGLCHILNKHINDKDFPTVKDLVSRIEDIIHKGEVDERHSNADKLVLVKDGYLVTIRKNVRENGKKIADKNWVLTAYNKDASATTKAPVDGTYGSTAVAPDTSSDAKIPTLFEIDKIPDGKVSEDGLLYRKPYGGNSGYVGYSISRRGAEAKAEGRYPKTEFRKEYGITEPSLKALVEAGVIDGGEWHHTSSYGNRTAFYGWSDGNGAEAYIRNKGEIDRLSRVMDKSSKLEAEVQGYGYGDQLDNYVQKLQLEGRYRQMMTPEERSEYRRRQDGVSDSGKPAAERIRLHKELENEYFTEQAKRERAYRDELRESDGFKAFAAEAAERKRQLDEAKRAAGEAKRRIGEIFEKAADEGMKFRDGGMGLDETITRMKIAASQANADNWQAKQEAMKAIGGNLNKLRIVGMQEFFCGSSL